MQLREVRSCYRFVNMRSCTVIAVVISGLSHYDTIYAWNLPSSYEHNLVSNRRSWLQQGGLAFVGFTSWVTFPNAGVAEFTPGGSLITDKEIGILVNNKEASPTRKYDNSNVLFDKDYYYKFGTAIPFIEPPGNTDFPKEMPFTKSQQRYDALKKYRDRIVTGLDYIKSLENIQSVSDIPDPKSSDDIYRLRAMGLLANALLASDNSGLPNEVFLSRWYINEIYLRIDELRAANDESIRKQLYPLLKKAVNSYLTLMNRVITSKVGEPFTYV
jgi:hypothetical protein